MVASRRHSCIDRSRFKNMLNFQCLVVLIAVFVTIHAYNEEVERRLDTSGPRPLSKGIHSFCQKYHPKRCIFCPYEMVNDIRQLCTLFYRGPKKSSGKREEGDEDIGERNLNELLNNLEEKINDF
ncbi:hypothetical protein LOTGIDRAFT_159737 [Lottia gigantea]|uniref:Uncharacterized protein n=1 Tax=Lottia gigantea TaxID=225164 RepID=V4ATE0_LOTGI|nr:hypothetical protein LOTGIDRAFT_159737 [Lottia gigantea]ESO96991.1 hypothetical protein LOTGIDRAFT_159737 [Lottia gigantea]